MAIPSRKLNPDDVAIIKALIAEGWLQSDIASLMGCNSGRIAEINSGQKHGAVAAAVLHSPEARARIAELQVAWILRIGRQLAAAMRPPGTMM